MRNLKLLILLFSVMVFFIQCNKRDPKENIIKTDTESENVDFIIVNNYPHNINSFTEGLFFENGDIYESTGAPNELPNTKSLFGILDLKSGEIDVKAELDKKIYFGEGIAKCNNKIYQLTYKNKTGFIYDSKTFKQIGLFHFDSDEGWGLTNVKNDSLIMSDGTNILTFLSPKTLKTIKRLEVKENNIPISNLNELEYVAGYIYANIYTTNKIIKIDSKNGNVIKTFDLTQLYEDSKRKYQGSLEMNGIAYNDNTNTFFITGKMWPCIYEIKLNY